MILDQSTIIRKYADLKFRNQKTRDKFIKSLRARLDREFDEIEKNKFIRALSDEIQKN